MVIGVGKMSLNMPSSTLSSSASDKNTLTVAKVPRIGPSSLRQLLPIVLCLISFATVLSVLIIYMDTTEFRHQQFRLNMSRDYELFSVKQDNPNLISYVREIHFHKYRIPTVHNGMPAEHINFTEHDLIQNIGQYIAGNLLNNKREGIFFQSFPGNNEIMMTAPWLMEKQNWSGYIVEPDPRKYFIHCKQYGHRQNVQAIHACLSPNEYPKEVTIHHDKENDVRINSIFDEDTETEWFFSRVKCFPIYTILLAVNHTTIDLLSLGYNRQELQILQTLPFDRVNIKVITIYLKEYLNDDDEFNSKQYIKNVTMFLLNKSYKLVKTIENNYIYLKNNLNLSTIRNL